MTDNQQYPQRTGRGMLLVASVGALALLTWYFDDVLQRQQNPNQQVIGEAKGIFNEITLQQNRQGHYVANGSINGYPVTFLLDTGASTMGLPLSVAKKVGAKGVSWGKSWTANGVVDVQNARLDSVLLGNIELRNVSASILPNMDGEDVLLGVNFLKDLELTQLNGELRIRQRRGDRD